MCISLRHGSPELLKAPGHTFEPGPFNDLGLHRWWWRMPVAGSGGSRMMPVMGKKLHIDQDKKIVFESQNPMS